MEYDVETLITHHQGPVARFTDAEFSILNSLTQEEARGNVIEKPVLGVRIPLHQVSIALATMLLGIVGVVVYVALAKRKRIVIKKAK
jgi:hypothetical protein